MIFTITINRTSEKTFENELYIRRLKGVFLTETEEGTFPQVELKTLEDMEELVLQMEKDGWQTIIAFDSPELFIEKFRY